MIINEDNLALFIARRIRTLREQAGYTVNGLSYRSGISQSYIRSIELGEKTNISVERLFYICQSLNISLGDFFDEPFELSSTPLDKAIHSLTEEQQIALHHFLDLMNKS